MQAVHSSQGQFGRGIGVGEEEGQRICRDEGIERVGYKYCSGLEG